MCGHRTVAKAFSVRWVEFSLLGRTLTGGFAPPFPCCIALRLHGEQPHRKKLLLKKATLGLTWAADISQ